MTDALCSHCLLPTGMRAVPRTVNGEACSFCCYGCRIAHEVRHGRGEEAESAWLLVRLGVGGFLSMNIMLVSLLIYADAFSGEDAWLIPWIHGLLWLLATPALIIVGGPFLHETWSQARRGRVSSSALIVVGVAAAYLHSALGVLVGGRAVYFDTASMVLVLFTLGRLLEAAGRARAARDLTPLLAAESEWATVVVAGSEILRPARDVASGMLVRVRPGDRIPVDGVIAEGASFIDEAVITGESRQIAKAAGDAVIAGGIAVDGALLIECRGAAGDNRWARICRSVRDTLATSSPITRVADRVVVVMVPVVLALAGATLAYWSARWAFDQALLAALAVLVVACPCAVGLAAPMATSLGIGRLARHGCLVRGPAVLETLARTRLIAFDKTGTLTEGRARLVDILTDDAGSDEVLALAAGLARESAHVLARAVSAAAAARGVLAVATRDVRVVPGQGLRGRVGGQDVAAGSLVLMENLGWTLPPALAEPARAREAAGHSMVFVGWDERVRAALSLDDTPLPEARSTVAALRGLKLRVALLTGDLEPVARRVAGVIGVEDWQAGLSPEAKAGALERRRHRGLVAMVGDGLNDGPVLAGADIGIAVGSATDLARETADLVLPPDGFWLLPWVVTVARAVRRTILTNLAWAFGYNLVALALAACGLLQPIVAAAVMAGSSLLVVMNSLRLERLPEPRRPLQAERQPHDDTGVRHGAVDGDRRVAAARHRVDQPHAEAATAR